MLPGRWNSGYTAQRVVLSNKIARIYLDVLEDIMGKNGLNSVLHKAGLELLIDNYPPSDLKKAVRLCPVFVLESGVG